MFAHCAEGTTSQPKAHHQAKPTSLAPGGKHRSANLLYRRSPWRVLFFLIHLPCENPVWPADGRGVLAMNLRPSKSRITMEQGIDFLRLSRRKSSVHFANASICFPTFFLSGKNLPLFAYANRKKSPSLFVKDDTSSTANAVPLASRSPPHSQMLSPAPARLCILLALGDTV